MPLTSRLPEFDLAHKRVIVRFDGNVPLTGTTIANDYRLTTILPTLTSIKNKGGTTTLITHIGRPKQREAQLSTRILQPWFERHGFTVAFAADTQKAYDLSMSKAHDIVLLENVRFWAEEKTQDRAFAQELARLGEFYVNDAFATLHRADTSVTLLAEQFAPTHRTIGLLVEHELKALGALHNPEHPFLVVIGGGKPETKIPVIEALLNNADTVALVPALNFTFNKALDKAVGASLVDDTLLGTARMIMNDASHSTTQLLLPTDYRIAYTKNGPLTTVTQEQFPSDGIGISLGPDSMQQILACINNAKTIFFNGSMGFHDIPETLTESAALLQAIAATDAYSVVAGGNSLDLAFKLHLEDAFDYLSTGGGATLAYIAGEPLPGLTLFMRDETLYD